MPLDDDFDPDVVLFLRTLGMDETELAQEIEIAKALLIREGYSVL